MSNYDSQAVYDVIDPEGIKVGELRKGLYFEGDWKVGALDGDVFHYEGKPAGKLEGLTVTRGDRPDKRLTQFQLVLQTKA